MVNVCVHCQALKLTPTLPTVPDHLTKIVLEQSVLQPSSLRDGDHPALYRCSECPGIWAYDANDGWAMSFPSTGKSNQA